MLTQDEINLMEWDLAHLDTLIDEVGEMCAKRFPRNEEVAKRMKSIRSAYKRLTETLLVEMYKETNDETDGH